MFEYYWETMTGDLVEPEGTFLVYFAFRANMETRQNKTSLQRHVAQRKQAV